VHFITDTKAHCNESIILQIETLETTPGFARIHLSTVTAKKGEQVQKWVHMYVYVCVCVFVCVCTLIEGHLFTDLLTP
jgi:uncharacterized membrane protein affecting hemolysin expression